MSSKLERQSALKSVDRLMVLALPQRSQEIAFSKCAVGTSANKGYISYQRYLSEKANRGGKDQSGIAML